MSGDWRRELEAAIQSELTLEEIVSLLRRQKMLGLSRNEVYSFLVSLREEARDEATEDCILEVADFVAGFCSPHMKIWDS